MSDALEKKIRSHKWTSDYKEGVRELRRLSELPSSSGSAFTQGYVCAVAEIIRTHDEPTIAQDVLRGAGKVDWDCIDDYDKATLQKAGLYNAERPN